MAEMMVGQTLHVPSRETTKPGDVALKVNDLTLQSASPFGTSLKNVSFEVRKGEVFGIGGVAGNGQDELLAALSGEVETGAGAVQSEGPVCWHLGPNERRAEGLLAAPEERLGHAAAPDMSLTENAMLTGHVRENLTNRGFLNWRRPRDLPRR